MRRDELLLIDMLGAAEAVSGFLDAVDEATFADSDLLQSAVLQKLMVIGEAAGRVSPEVRDRWPDVPWRSMSGFRNLAVHAYFEVEWSIVENRHGFPSGAAGPGRGFTEERLPPRRRAARARHPADVGPASEWGEHLSPGSRGGSRLAIDGPDQRSVFGNPWNLGADRLPDRHFRPAPRRRGREEVPSAAGPPAGLAPRMEGEGAGQAHPDGDLSGGVVRPCVRGGVEAVAGIVARLVELYLPHLQHVYLDLTIWSWQ
jgi:uncharacterized protein with HEPN domain